MHQSLSLGDVGHGQIAESGRFLALFTDARRTPGPPALLKAAAVAAVASGTAIQVAPLVGAVTLGVALFCEQQADKCEVLVGNT